MKAQEQSPRKLTKEDLKILQQLSTSKPKDVSADKHADQKVNRIILKRLIEVLQDGDEQKAA